MINTVKVSAGDFGGPVREWSFPPVDYIEDKPICERKRSILVDLIFQKASSSTEREMWLNQVSTLSSEEAENFIFALLTNTWK